MAQATQDEINALGESLRAPKTAELVAWSQNYEYGKRPLDVFLDLTGIYADGWGWGEHCVFERNKETQKVRVPVAHEFLAHDEITYIAEALIEYSSRPQQVEALFEALDRLEQEG